MDNVKGSRIEMEYLEVGLCFVIGLTLILLIAYSLRIKKKGLRMLALNSVIGAGIIALVSVSRVLYLPLSPLTAIISGVFGVPGVAVIVVFTLFLG